MEKRGEAGRSLGVLLRRGGVSVTPRKRWVKETNRAGNYRLRRRQRDEQNKQRGDALPTHPGLTARSEKIGGGGRLLLRKKKRKDSWNRHGPEVDHRAAGKWEELIGDRRSS